MGNKNSGPKRRPLALQLLRGVTRKDRLNIHEPKVPPGPVVKPERLVGAAAQVWEELAPMCVQMGTLTPADVSAFAMLCELRTSADRIAEEKQDPKFTPLVMKACVDGDGNIHLEAREHPILRMERATATTLRPYFALFGLEPSGRARMQVAPKVEAPVSKWAGALP